MVMHDRKNIFHCKFKTDIKNVKKGAIAIKIFNFSSLLPFIQFSFFTSSSKVIGSFFKIQFYFTTFAVQFEINSKFSVTK